MKTLITVSWSHTVEIEVDPILIAANNQPYIDNIKDKAIAIASNDLSLSSGMVTDCEAFPEICD